MSTKTKQSLKRVYHLFKLASEEIKQSVDLLTEHNLRLSTMSFTRQIFELTRVVEILNDQPGHLWSWCREVREIEKKKLENSSYPSSDDVDYKNHIDKEIDTCNTYLDASGTVFEDWKKQKEDWNTANKDPAIYNKFSEATHLELSYLIVHYMQNKTAADDPDIQAAGIDTSNWDEDQTDAYNISLFEYWHNRCVEAVEKGVKLNS